MKTIDFLFDRTTKWIILCSFFRYLEAIELNKSLDVVHKLKSNDALKITSNLVNGFEKSLPKSMRTKSCGRPIFQNLYKKKGKLH